MPCSSVFWRKRSCPWVPPVDHLREKYRRFEPLLTVIRQDPRRDLSVARMAEIMKMGKESFVKRFSAEIGTSPKLFFNRIRAPERQELPPEPAARRPKEGKFLKSRRPDA